jgi:hypothetical protein
MGGKTWPTAASISKTGLMAPEDMAVAVAGGQGGTYSGHFVSEMIPIPDGMVWDVLYLDADIPDGMEVAITVLDSGQDPLTVYTELPGPAVDLSHIGPWRSIYVQVDVTSDNNTTSPTLRSLLVNWHPENVWRDQFFGDIKSESMLNLEERALRLMPSGATSTLPDLVFAGRRSDNLYDVKSLAFMDAGSMDYLSTPPLVFNTVGATAVDAYDINGDGIPDLAFSSYGTSPTNQVGESYVFLGSPSGWYDVPYHTFSTYAASDILMDDLNNDGYADVVIAQDQAAGPSAVSLLFWGSEDGWETDPDVEFDTRGSRAVEAADLDGDGLKDLVFAYHVEGNSTIFYQESVGFCGTVPSHKLSTSWAWDVACGDLDGDGNQDLVFANAFDGVTFSVNSKVFWGQNGRGFKAVPTYLPTMGARGVAIADVDNDMDLDVIFANSRNASSGYKSEAGVYINDGSGGLTTTSMHYVGTDGASAVAVVDLDGRGVMDLVVASRNNGTTYRIPSMGYVGQTGSWPWEPSILFPTTGAVDVLPVSLSSPERGGYLSEAITPNPNDDPGAYGTLWYVADMGPGQGGTISVLDADTGHLLAETQMVGGENEWDISTLVSYRDHPSIRVEVEVLDLVRNPGFDLDDLWLNWTERVPKAPLVVDISISDTTVYRDDSVMLTVTVYDEFDLPKDLTLVVEHQLEGQTDWRTFLLSGRSFEDGVWNVTIRPDRFVPLGSYTFRVNVTDSDDLYSGYVELGQTLEVLPNLAKAPTLLTATAYNGMVELEWRAPHDTGDLPLDGYRVLRGRTGNDLSGITTTDAFADEYQDTGLTNGVTYFYAVVAYNDLGDSPWSEVLNATPLGVPGVPLDLSVNPGDGNVTIAWSPPALDGGSPVTGYRVFRGVFDGPLEEIATLGTVSEYLDEGLVNGQEYFFTVLAINDLGDGPQAVALPVVPLGPPGAPTGLTVRTDVMLLTISWDAPVDTGGSVLTGFIIYRGTSEDSLEFLQAMPASASNYADADLIAGQTYHYAVAAETAAGEGPLSPPVSSTAMNVPDAPADLVVEAGDGEVTLNWILPFDGGSPIIGCTVRRESGGNVETFPLWDVTTYIDASVVNGQTYIYSVNARNDMGDGPYTGPEEVTPMAALTVPDRVTSLSAVAKGGKVTVSWSPPSDDGGSVLTGYIVYRGEDVDSLTEIAQVGLVTSYLDEDVEGGKTYLYTVKAVNAVGPGPWVNAVSAKVQKEEVDEDEFPMLLMLGIVLVLVAIFIGRVLRPRLMGD